MFIYVHICIHRPTSIYTYIRQSKYMYVYRYIHFYIYIIV